MKLPISLRSFIKYLITISLISTILLNIKLRHQQQQQQQDDKDNDLLLFINQTQLDKTIQIDLNNNLTYTEIETIKTKISNINNNYINDKDFEKIDKICLIILIQVHKRVKYLSKLIDSLNNLNLNLNNTVLVIYSHDYFDHEINNLIKIKSNFFYKQIFYPYMLQIYKNEFPNKQINDCPKTIKKHLALRMRCINAANPDSYGNYREANIVQIKHHWFWKLAFIFDSYKLTKLNKNFGILLLEEDYYLMPDTLYMLDLLTKRLVNEKIFIVFLITVSDFFKYSK